MINTQKVSFVRSAASGQDFLRDGRPAIVFAGRSNVGKSSLINSLLNRKNYAWVGGTPGKTAQINYFLVDGIYFVDLPGYGYARVSGDERRRWGELMEEYFSQSGLITAGIQIVDIRHAPTEDDRTMREFFLGSEVPFITVANKADKLKKSELEPCLAKIREFLEMDGEEPLLAYSCLNGTGRGELLSFIEKSV
mgnify:CR=1 FL=1